MHRCARKYSRWVRHRRFEPTRSPDTKTCIGRNPPRERLRPLDHQGEVARALPLQFTPLARARPSHPMPLRCSDERSGLHDRCRSLRRLMQ